MHFLGEFELTLTKDGRVNLPAKYVQMIKQMNETIESKDEVFLMGSADHVIEVYNSFFLGQLTKQISNLFILEEVLQGFNRDFYSQLDNIYFDNQGRITLGKKYLDKLQSSAKPNKIIAVGCGDYFELWSLESYKVYKDGYKRNNKQSLNKRIITQLLKTTTNEK